MIRLKPRIKPKLKRLALSKPVTVCIAAVAEYEDVVTVSDKKLTKGFYSSEDASLKMKGLIGEWSAMIAGKIDQLQNFIPHFDKAIGSNTSPNIHEIIEMLTSAYQGLSKQLAAERLLGNFGWDVETFLKSRSQLGDALYERMFTEISKAHPDLDLLVFGYHEDYPRIFIVSNPTDENPSHVTHCDEFGFGVVGGGYFMAESTLYALGQKPDVDFPTTIYNVLCAKFAAETASDVGEKTFAQVFRAANFTIEISPQFISRVRQEWNQYGKPLMRREGHRIAATEAARINKRFQRASQFRQ